MMASGGELWKLQCVLSEVLSIVSLLIAALTKATSGTERLVTAHMYLVEYLCSVENKKTSSKRD